MLYAVDPVGVEKIIPSAWTVVRCVSSQKVSSDAKYGLLPLSMTTSFKTLKRALTTPSRFTMLHSRRIRIDILMLLSAPNLNLGFFDIASDSTSTASSKPSSLTGSSWTRLEWCFPFQAMAAASFISSPLSMSPNEPLIASIISCFANGVRNPKLPPAMQRIGGTGPLNIWLANINKPSPPNVTTRSGVGTLLRTSSKSSGI
mmetsp:Transcript_10744/g.14019  ORF Transcript_10744/g.14019 Transcript_10744/m.14019 type:complete len:202 (-) Transcript_10744:754-1359(-)